MVIALDDVASTMVIDAITSCLQLKGTNLLEMVRLALLVNRERRFLA